MDEPVDGREWSERRIVSVLFADLVGFTALSEHLDPEDVATVQDAYFAAVRETIGRYGGRLEKFIGDAAMAVFGVPRTLDDDAERAIRAGLALASAVEQLAAKVGLSEGDLRVRVGVNTGEVLYAETGSGDWRVTGDAVNVASRFQAAAPPGGVLVGETAALASEQAVELEPVGRIELKGKTDPVRAWVAMGVRPSPSREHAMGGLRAPILGRGKELGLLAEALRRVAVGGSERIVVVAPPGVGKSRLLEEWAREAERAGARVWRSRLRPDLLAPFEPVAQVFASALTSLTSARVPPDASSNGHPDGGGFPRDTVAAVLWDRFSIIGTPPARLEVVIHEVMAVFSPTSEGDGGPAPMGAGIREQRFIAWLEALDALAGDAAWIWMVEDVHWAGGDLLAFLQLAGREPSPYGRLVLASARPSLLERAPYWCAEDASEGARLLSLVTLSPVHAGELIRELVGDALPNELVEAVAERSDGNPLFIEELLRTWISAGTLVRIDEEGWRLVEAANEVPVPATVQSIYAAQLDDLPGPARTAARRASVAGRRFPVASLGRLGVLEAGPALEVLHRRALVSGPLQDPLLGLSYVFRHALLRDAGYASLARAERALLHVRLARWLEQAAGRRVAEVAEVIGNHYRAALASTPRLSPDVGDGLSREAAAELAAVWFERAADAAMEVAAHDAARVLLRQALDLTSDAAALDRARRWQRLGDATAYVADMDEGAAAYEMAANLFAGILHDQETPEDLEAARRGYADSVTALGLVRIQQLRFKEAVALAEGALGTIGSADDPPSGWLRYVRAWGTLAWAFRPEVRLDLEAALDIARTHGDRRLELEARFMLLSTRMEQGEIGLAESDAMDVELATLAENNGQWDRASRTWRVRAVIRSEQGDDGWHQMLDRATAVAEAHGLTEETAWNDYARTEVGLLRGDLDAATLSGLRALDLADRNAYHRVQVRTWFALSPIAAAQGRRDLLERAFRWFDENRAIFPASPYGRFMHAAVDCRLAAAGLPVTPALDEDLLEFWAETQGWASGYVAMETIIGAWISAGDADLAAQGVERAAGWADHPTMTAFYRGEVALLRSIVVQVGNDREAEAAREALNTFRRLNAPWWIAKAIRNLERVGGATPEELEEASGIERALRLVGPAA